MNTTIRQLAGALEIDFVGNGDAVVSAIAEPIAAQGSVLAIAFTDKYVQVLKDSEARLAFLSKPDGWQEMGLEAALISPRARYSMAHLSKHYDKYWRQGKGCCETCVIHPTAQVAQDAVFGSFCVIGAGVKIEQGAHFGSHVCIGADTHIGPQATLASHVTIGLAVKIGERFIAHSGAVIGSDGFSFDTEKPSDVSDIRKSLGKNEDIKHSDRQWCRIHSLGAVEIGADVEIGANTCIDRGSMGNTMVGDGCKIDNLVQIAHNVSIGENSLICGMSGVAGSARIGKNVILGGRVAVNDNIFIGDNVFAAGDSRIFTNVAAGRIIMGDPAVDMKKQIEIIKSLRRLPRFMRSFADKK